MPSTALVLRNENELLHRPTPPMLVDDLLVQGSLSALVSKYGVGKSFLALDLALSIAAGRKSYLGMPLRQKGPVVYVLAEGAGRFGLRMKLWRQAYGVKGPLPFYWIDGPVDLTDENAVREFIAAIQEVNPALVVFDTLSRCLVGADENSQQAMTVAVDHADLIRKSVPGLSVLLLHHMNASGTRERGSTTIPGALDTMLILRSRMRQAGKTAKPDKGYVILSTEKQKDVEHLDPLHLRARILAIEGEYEENGEASTSVIWLPHGAEISTNPEDEVMQLVGENPGRTKSSIAIALGGRRADALKLIDDMVANNLLKVVLKGQAQCLHPVSTH